MAPSAHAACFRTPASSISEGLCPSDSPARSLARRFAGALRSRGSLAALARFASAASLIALSTDGAECPRRLLPHAGVLVLQSSGETRNRAAVAERAKRPRRLLADAGGGV